MRLARPDRGLALATAALLSAMSALLLSVPVWFIGSMTGSLGLFIVGSALAGAAGGVMGTGVSRAILSNEAADRLCAGCIAAGTGAAMAIAPVCMHFVNARLGNISNELGMMIIGALAFAGAVLGHVTLLALRPE